MEVEIKLVDVVRIEVAGFQYDKWRPRKWFRWYPTRTRVRLISFVDNQQVSDRWYSMSDASKITVDLRDERT